MVCRELFAEEGPRLLCGNGDDAFILAANGVQHVTGVDLSEISIRNCRQIAESHGLANVLFMTMDAESLEFEDSSFDVVTEYEALHHLKLERAYAGISRVLKPDGKAICVETLGHNRIIHWYRRRTAHLRTEWEVEHILQKKDIKMAKNYFLKVDILGFFHLASLAAVPFRNLRGFVALMLIIETVDSIILKLPIIKWQSWQVIFILSNPVKEPKGE